MPSWRVSRKASLSNQITHFGIMGGLSNSRVATHTNRATNTLRIPKPAAAGLQFMRMHNLLSKNPQGSGGVGKMVKNSPCNCRSVVKKTVVTLEDNNLGEDSLGDNKPNESCASHQCLDASGSFGCSFQSQHDNYYCCPSGNYDDSGCSTSEHVCYINEPDNSGCLATRFSHCPSGACVWDGTRDISDVFSSCDSDTVIITQDITDISKTITVPPGKTLISYGRLSFNDIRDSGTGIYIDGAFGSATFGSATFLNTVSFGNISNNGTGIEIDGSGTFLNTVSFGNISNNSTGIEIDGSGTFLNTVSFSGSNNGYGIYIAGSGTFLNTVSLSGSNNGTGIYIDGLGTFLNTVRFSEISNNGYGILLTNGSGTFRDTVSFSDINNSTGIYIDGSAMFNDICFNQPLNGHGIDVRQNSDFSYNKICGEPSGNVWPENKQKNFYPCEQSS